MCRWELNQLFNGKNILVTGGTGSFGKKFIKILLEQYRPKKVIVYSRDELKQFGCPHRKVAAGQEGK